MVTLKEICKEMVDNCIGIADVSKEIEYLSRKQKNWYSKYFIKGDIHLSEEGNRVMARIIKPFLIEFFSLN